MRDGDVLHRWDRTGLASLGWRDWILVYSDIDRFVVVGLQMIRDAHERAWNEAASQSATEDFWDLGEAYDQLVDGLNSVEHEWMYLAAALKDAVTAFEVYLEALVDEILAVHGVGGGSDRKLSPWWRDLKRWYRIHVDVDLEADGVKQVREVRHILTHRRGELRTEAEREVWGGQNGFGDRTIDLEVDGVRKMMETLAHKVSTIEDAGSKYTRFGGERFEAGELTPP